MNGKEYVRRPIIQAYNTCKEGCFSSWDKVVRKCQEHYPRFAACAEASQKKCMDAYNDYISFWLCPILCFLIFFFTIPFLMLVSLVNLDRLLNHCPFLCIFVVSSVLLVNWLFPFVKQVFCFADRKVSKFIRKKL